MKIGGDGGLIALDRSGSICLDFNTEGMYRAMKSSSGIEHVAIYAD
jgi:beta-aspartyl-peptidase (threonine type)